MNKFIECQQNRAELKFGATRQIKIVSNSCLSLEGVLITMSWQVSWLLLSMIAHAAFPGRWTQWTFGTTLMRRGVTVAGQLSNYRTKARHEIPFSPHALSEAPST